MGNTVEELARCWDKFSLMDEASVEVEIETEALEEITHKGKSCLVGKLIADRVISKEIIRRTLVKGWLPRGTTSFRVLGENLFLVEFEDE
ncbi:hypothetical protein SLA2020_454390 [Shorea laevis]